MSLVPVLIDSTPSYLSHGAGKSSLLLVPFGTRTLIEYVLECTAKITSVQAMVVLPRSIDRRYRDALSEMCSSIRQVSGWNELWDIFAAREISDRLLLIDPRWFPSRGFEIELLRHFRSPEPRWTIHLVAFDKGPADAREYLDSDAEGRIRRIQRYYDGLTWPFMIGVVASLIPVSTVIGRRPRAKSLMELRSDLVGAGAATRDVEPQGDVHDLNDEAGLLTARDACIVREMNALRNSRRISTPLLLGSGHDIHPTAIIAGPVIVESDVVIEPRAKIIGPAMIGRGVRVQTGAVVSRTTVAAGSCVPRNSIVHEWAVFQTTDKVGVRGFESSSKPDPNTFLQQQTAPKLTASESLKRLVDVTIAALGLIILAPIWLTVAILIRLSSRGPILYGDNREGRGGRVFCCWKFRTMYDGAAAKQRDLMACNQTDGPQFKLDVGSQPDPRATPVGRLLRSTNLDELPQLINVLRGEMSLVGPRPSPFRENQVCIPWRKARLSVHPGISGLWQVCRHNRTAGDFHQWIGYDLLYVRHQSMWLDLKILIATVLTLGGRGHVPLSWILREDDHIPSA